MADSILEGIVEHIATCPLLQDGVFRVDALGDQAVEYTIETGVFDPVIKRYVNGDEVKQYQFNFGSREYYSMDRIQNIQNSAFYEKFANWIEDQNRKEIFPDLPGNCYAEKIEVLSNGYMFDGSMRNARYQIQLRLIYQKEVAQECQNEQQ